MNFFEQLRRYPDVEAPNLFAVDATDRLLLDEASGAIAALQPGELAVIEDNYGALTLGAVALHGARDVRVSIDSLTREMALDNNAALTGLGGSYARFELGPQLLSGARVVLIQAPKSLAALREIAYCVAAFADPSVQVFVGGRVKHLTLAMNDVLAAHFSQVSASRARQKSRVIRASQAQPPTAASPFPLRQFHEDLGIWVCAHGMAFAGTKIDIGTRALLGQLGKMMPEASNAVDLGCGTGVLATLLARDRSGLTVLATDDSAAAIASTRATLAANGLSDRVATERADTMTNLQAASADLILCNPPFHSGASVNTMSALKLFSGAARVLRPGGQFWTVFNSPLAYRSELVSRIGATKLVWRDSKFTVTVSTRSGRVEQPR